MNWFHLRVRITVIRSWASGILDLEDHIEYAEDLDDEDGEEDAIVSKVLEDIRGEESARWNTSKEENIQQANPCSSGSKRGNICKEGVHPNKKTCDATKEAVDSSGKQVLGWPGLQ